MYKKCVKRIIDLVVGLLVLILFCWLYLIVALLVKIKIGSPILFSQERPGKDEKIFKMYKFRTMTNACDENGKLLPDKDRLTKFGSFLRKTSLDELPEIFNIVKGDMSLIGPRPLLVSYLPYYSEKEKIRHSVRPGLTGLAQVSGRNFIDWDNRLKKDIEYVENIGFAEDIKIIFMTIKTVLGHSDNVAQDTNAAEGNFAEIRKKRLEETGKLEL